MLRVSAQINQDDGRQAGFTMVEILIVVIIVTVLAGAISLTVNVNSEQKELVKQRERLKLIFKSARDHATFTGSALALEIFEDGLRFLEVDESEFDFMEWGLEKKQETDPNDPNSFSEQNDETLTNDSLLKWRVITEKRTLNQKMLPEGFTYALEVEEQPIELDEFENIDPDEADEETQTKFSPQIYFSDDGSVTPFSITILHDEENLAQKLEISMVGEIGEDGKDEDN